MKDGTATDIGNARRSNTAELRRRFDDVTTLLNDGYNHKQICEHLNTQGLAIPYPQYRAIMTRLRREKSELGTGPQCSSPLVPPASVTDTRPLMVVPLVPPDKAIREPEQEKKISWDPSSEVKWK